LLRNATRIVNIGNRAATRVALAAPQAHGDTNNFVPSGLQLGSGNR
jgi:hypothetical protein